MVLNYNRIDDDAVVVYNDIFEAHIYRNTNRSYGGVILYGLCFEKTFQRFVNEPTASAIWYKVYSALRFANYNRRYYLF